MSTLWPATTEAAEPPGSAYLTARQIQALIVQHDSRLVARIFRLGSNTWSLRFYTHDRHTLETVDLGLAASTRNPASPREFKTLDSVANYLREQYAAVGDVPRTAELAI